MGPAALGESHRLGAGTAGLTLRFAPGEAPADSGTKATVAVKEELQEDQARPPARAPRTLSSFFGEFLAQGAHPAPACPQEVWLPSATRS